MTTYPLPQSIHTAIFLPCTIITIMSWQRSSIAANSILNIVKLIIGRSRKRPKNYMQMIFLKRYSLYEYVNNMANSRSRFNFPQIVWTRPDMNYETNLHWQAFAPACNDLLLISYNLVFTMG